MVQRGVSGLAAAVLTAVDLNSTLDNTLDILQESVPRGFFEELTKDQLIDALVLYDKAMVSAIHDTLYNNDTYSDATIDAFGAVSKYFVEL